MFRRFTFLLFFTLLLTPTIASAQIVSVRSVMEIPPPSAARHWHSLILRHAAPSTILKWMNWDIPADGAKNPNLPDGVARIFTLQSNNSLLVEATNSGYAKFKQIVTALDIAPRQIQLNVLLAAVPNSFNLAIDLTDPSGALATLQKDNSALYQSRSLTVDTGTPAEFPIDLTLPRLETDLPPWSLLVGLSWNTMATIPTFRLEPRVNTDNSITLLTTAGADGTATAIHTVIGGGLWVYEVTRLAQKPVYRVFLFVTPTILAEKSRTGDEEYQTVTVTP